MPRKKTVPEAAAETTAVETLDSEAMPNEGILPVPGPEAAPEDGAPKEPPTAPELDGAPAAPGGTGEDTPEFLSVEPDPSPDAGDEDSGRIASSERSEGDLWLDTGANETKRDLPGPDPMEELPPVPAEVSDAAAALPDMETAHDGEDGSAIAEDTPPTAEAGAADDDSAGPKPRPRRGRPRKADAGGKQTGELPAAVETAEAAPPPAGEDDRRAFYGLDFNALDRDLSPEQRQEWNSIYASFRGHSVLTGSIAGVDRHSVRIRDRRTGDMVRQEMYCATVIPFRVRIIIPSAEMWMQGEERPDYVLRNMSGASIDFVVTHVDREAGFAIASRRLALRTRRYYFSTQPTMNRPGARIRCRVLAVGPRRCLVECGGYDIDLTQREMRYTAIPDLRTQYHRGEELDCVVKGYDRESGRLVISVKETNPNPFDGAELRHPEGSRRQAEIAGKYGGGVFCNLPDGAVVMCSYSFHYDDSAFAVGDKVIVAIQRYDFGKKQIYGKIVAKW